MDFLVNEKEHVRQLIKKAKGLPARVNDVLAEVVSMCIYGNQQAFTASNTHLEKALGLTKPKVSAHLHTLIRIGLLTIEGNSNGSGTGRRITLTPALQRAIESGLGSLTELIRGCYKPYRNDKGSLTETVTKPYRNDNHNRREENREEYSTLLSAKNELEQQVATLRAAVLELEEKNQAQAERLRKAERQYRQDQQALKALTQERNELLARAPKPDKVPKADAVSAAHPTLSFDAFWDAYDKKKGSKANARRLWEKQSEAARRSILAGLDDYKATASNKQFLPYPETFLNGKVWEAEEWNRPDQPAAPAQPTPQSFFCAPQHESAFLKPEDLNLELISEQKRQQDEAFRLRIQQFNQQYATAN